MVREDMKQQAEGGESRTVMQTSAAILTASARMCDEPARRALCWTGRRTDVGGTAPQRHVHSGYYESMEA